MKFLHKIFSALAYLGFSTLGLALVAFGAGLAYQIDVAANVLLGWGYIAYILVLVILQVVLTRSLLVNNNGAALFLLVPNAFLILMIFGRFVMRQSFSGPISRADYHFWEALQEWSGSILGQYGLIALLVLGGAILSALLAWACSGTSPKRGRKDEKS